MSPVLLYDGECGFCAESVQLVLRYDRRGTARFAPLQGQFAAGVLAKHPELRAIDSIVWVEPSAAGAERVFVRSTAALHVARYLGGIWRAALLGYLLPARLRDALYDFVARHRHQLPGTRDACLIVPPEGRSRFLQ